MSLLNPNRDYDKLREAAAKARAPYERDIWLNVAFFLNEQYVEWTDATDGMMRRIPLKEGFENTPRPVANKIMHFVAQEHATALKNRPAPDVLPAGDSPLDISDAQVNQAYLRWLCDPVQANFDEQLSDATLWALVGCEGFLKWTYSEEHGRPDIMSVSPLDLYPDPYAKHFSKARYVIHSQFMDVESVFDKYGKEVKPTGIDKADPMRSALLREMGSAPALQGVLVNELWMRPTRRNPEGLFVVWAGKEQLVAPRPFPYEHKRLPFTQLGTIPRPGSLHYNCAVTYLRAPQMELNKYHAQALMIGEAFAAPKWFIDSALQLESEPDDSPRQVLRGDSQGGQLKPEIIQPTGMANDQRGEWIRREMMDTVGLHEVSQGGVPGRVEAARAIELLKETDDSRLHELTRTTSYAVSEGFWQCLSLAHQFVSTEQVVQTYSREGLPEVRRWKREMFKPGLRVQVTMGSGLLRGRAARQEQLTELWNLGILRDPEVMADLMEIPIATLTPQTIHDVRLARNENISIAEGTGLDGKPGQAIMPNSWDDHGIHIREHNNYRKTAEYMALPSSVKTKFEHHVDQHETMWDQQLQKDMKRQMMLAQASGQMPPGQPGPAGDGAPPAGPNGAGAENPSATPQDQAVS